MGLRYVTVCSGIEAPTVAWEPLGWTPVAFSEIDKFPCAVLAHRYPTVPNLGDMTKHKEWDIGTVDLIVGGTPCQGFSVAGKRGGLDDDRSGLARVFIDLIEQVRPRWVVWENVPGVLSLNEGRDFGAFLGALGNVGYGFAYRVLDAQYVRVESHPFAVPQRRRRVFVVGHLGDWRCAAAVLSERESLRRHSSPRREAGKRVAPCLADGARGRCNDINRGVVEVSPALRAKANTSNRADSMACIPEVAWSLQERDSKGADSSTEEGHLIPVAHSLLGDVAGTLEAAQDRGNRGQGAISGMRVRRLTPLECERLQGFPDGWTNVPYGPPRHPKQICPDGPRYKALGNSIAVNVLRWIGERIQIVDELK